MGVRFEGLSALQQGLLVRSKMDEVKKVVKYDGQQLQREMQKDAVFRKGYSQGTTQKSIDLHFGVNGMSADVGPRTDYSPYLEYGTRFMEAQPFILPAYSAIKPKFIQHLVKLFK